MRTYLQFSLLLIIQLYGFVKVIQSVQVRVSANSSCYANCAQTSGQAYNNIWTAIYENRNSSQLEIQLEAYTNQHVSFYLMARQTDDKGNILTNLPKQITIADSITIKSTNPNCNIFLNLGSNCFIIPPILFIKDDQLSLIIPGTLKIDGVIISGQENIAQFNQDLLAKEDTELMHCLLQAKECCGYLQLPFQTHIKCKPDVIDIQIDPKNHEQSALFQLTGEKSQNIELKDVVINRFYSIKMTNIFWLKSTSSMHSKQLIKIEQSTFDDIFLSMSLLQVDQLGEGSKIQFIQSSIVFMNRYGYRIQQPNGDPYKGTMGSILHISQTIGDSGFVLDSGTLYYNSIQSGLYLFYLNKVKQITLNNCYFLLNSNTGFFRTEQSQVNIQNTFVFHNFITISFVNLIDIKDSSVEIVGGVISYNKITSYYTSCIQIYTIDQSNKDLIPQNIVFRSLTFNDNQVYGYANNILNVNLKSQKNTNIDMEQVNLGYNFIEQTSFLSNIININSVSQSQMRIASSLEMSSNIIYGRNASIVQINSTNLVSTAKIRMYYNNIQEVGAFSSILKVANSPKIEFDGFDVLFNYIYSPGQIVMISKCPSLNFTKEITLQNNTITPTVFEHKSGIFSITDSNIFSKEIILLFNTIKDSSQLVNSRREYEQNSFPSVLFIQNSSITFDKIQLTSNYIMNGYAFMSAILEHLIIDQIDATKNTITPNMDNGLLYIDTIQKQGKVERLLISENIYKLSANNDHREINSVFFFRKYGNFLIKDLEILHQYIEDDQVLLDFTDATSFLDVQNLTTTQLTISSKGSLVLLNNSDINCTFYNITFIGITCDSCSVFRSYNSHVVVTNSTIQGVQGRELGINWLFEFEKSFLVIQNCEIIIDQIREMGIFKGLSSVFQFISSKLYAKDQNHRIQCSNCTNLIFVDGLDFNIIQSEFYNLHLSGTLSLASFFKTQVTINNTIFQNVTLERGPLITGVSSSFIQGIVEYRQVTHHNHGFLYSLLGFQDYTFYICNSTLDQISSFVSSEAAKEFIAIKLIVKTDHPFINMIRLKALKKVIISEGVIDTTYSLAESIIAIGMEVKALQIVNMIFMNSNTKSGIISQKIVQPSNITISDTKFINNTVIGGDGACFRLQTKAKVDLEINDCEFSSNTALNWNGFGGYGGALYLYGDGDQELIFLSLDNTTFQSNYADIAGSVIYSSQTNLQQNLQNSTTNKFHNNTIMYNTSTPSDIQTQPKHLVLQLNEKCTQDSLQMQQEEKANSYILEYLRHSHHLDEITFQVLDQQNNIYNYGSHVELCLEKVSSIPNTEGIITFYHKQLVQSGVITLSQFLPVFPSNVSEVTFIVQTCNSRVSTLSLEKLKITLKFEKCRMGEYYHNNECVPCMVGYYQPHKDGHLETECLNCDEKLQCLGGNNITTRQGYWKLNNNSDIILRCPNHESCVKPILDPVSSEQVSVECRQGHTGNLCANCIENWTHRSLSENCKECPQKWLIIFKLAINIILNVLLGSIWSYSNRVEVRGRASSSLKKELELKYARGFMIRILIDHVQMQSIIGLMSIVWPRMMNESLEKQESLIFSNIDVFELNCLFGTKMNIFGLEDPYSKPILGLMYFAILFIFLWILGKILYRNSEDVLPQSIIAIFIITFNICLLPIMKETLKLIRCIKIERFDDPTMVMMDNYETICWDNTHKHYIRTILHPIIWSIGIIIPITIFIFYCFYANKADSLSVRSRLGVTFSGYSNNRRGWEIVLFLKKSGLMAIYFLQSILNTGVTSLLYVAGISLFLLVQYQFQPYENFHVNILANYSVFISLLLVLASVYYQSMLSEQIFISLLSNSLYYLNVLFGLSWLLKMIQMQLAILELKESFQKKFQKFINYHAILRYLFNTKGITQPKKQSLASVGIATKFSEKQNNTTTRTKEIFRSARLQSGQILIDGIDIGIGTIENKDDIFKKNIPLSQNVYPYEMKGRSYIDDDVDKNDAYESGEFINKDKQIQNQGLNEQERKNIDQVIEREEDLDNSQQQITTNNIQEEQNESDDDESDIIQLDKIFYNVNDSEVSDSESQNDEKVKVEM